jgi:hypothetical protein
VLQPSIHGRKHSELYVQLRVFPVLLSPCLNRSCRSSFLYRVFDARPVKLPHPYVSVKFLLRWTLSTTIAQVFKHENRNRSFHHKASSVGTKTSTSSGSVTSQNASAINLTRHQIQKLWSRTMDPSSMLPDNEVEHFTHYVEVRGTWDRARRSGSEGVFEVLQRNRLEGVHDQSVGAPRHLSTGHTRSSGVMSWYEMVSPSVLSGSYFVQS